MEKTKKPEQDAAAAYRSLRDKMIKRLDAEFMKHPGDLLIALQQLEELRNIRAKRELSDFENEAQVPYEMRLVDSLGF